MSSVDVLSTSTPSTDPASQPLPTVPHKINTNQFQLTQTQGSINCVCVESEITKLGKVVPPVEIINLDEVRDNTFWESRTLDSGNPS